MVIGLLLVLAFSQTARPAARQGAEDDIREAVFNYMFNQGGPSPYLLSKGIYISVEDKDPSDDLCKRFAEHKPPVKKLSQSISIEYEGIRDKETGNPGILYYVGEVQWISPDEARVRGSHYVAPLEAGGCNYKVVFEDKKWAVKGCEGGEWISRVSPGIPDNVKWRIAL